VSTRREVLAGALAASVIGLTAGCGWWTGASGSGAHPALRRPRPHGVVALLTAAGDPAVVRTGLAELGRRGGETTMVGVGAAILDAAGLTAARPPVIGPMPPFPGDVPIADRTDVGVAVQIEDDSAEAVRRRADILFGGLPGLRVTWRTAVTRSVAGVDDGRRLQLNPFGFVEGQGNPADPVDQVLLRSGPQWTVGGSLLALRVIRMAHALWDADETEEQERIIGRRTDGHWLDGTAAFDEPRFAADPDGAVTPLDSHVRLVNPRTPDRPPPRMLRRSWTYGGGTAPGGVADEGMVFMAFQNDLAAGFVRAQERLRGEAMAPYLLAVGGGYYVVPTPDGLATLLAG